jgi:isoleucyl-tRNA synthetase
MLARLAELDVIVRQAYDEFDFNKVYSTLFAFCTNDLSAFYFDIRKDALYCDPKSSIRRRASRTVTDEAFRRIVTWFAPILCFTMEEAWTLRFPDGSVHLQLFAETPKGWADSALVEKWTRIRQLRRVVTGALEVARRDKIIGASLEAAPTLYVADAKDKALFDSVDLAEIAITSAARVEVAKSEGAFKLDDVPDVGATFHAADGAKCARCWMILPEVGKNPQHDDLCNRCSEAVDG